MNRLIRLLLCRLYRSKFTPLLNRGEIAHILNARRLIGEGAEVGVKYGQFSEHLLQHWSGKRLYSIDPWLECSAESYRDLANVGQAEQERNYLMAVQRLARFSDRSRVLRMTSEKASSMFPDKTLDFVYLDARHDSESVKQDLSIRYEKIVPGEILCGHDYLDGEIQSTLFGAKSAVDEFANIHRMTARVSWREPLYKSWLLVKPGS